MLREKFVEDREAYKQKYIDELEKNILLTGMTFEELVYKKITNGIEADEQITIDDIFYKEAHWAEIGGDEFHKIIKNIDDDDIKHTQNRRDNDVRELIITTVYGPYGYSWDESKAKEISEYFVEVESKKILFWETAMKTEHVKTTFYKRIASSSLDFNKYTVEYTAEKIRELGFWVKTEGNNIIVYWNEPQNEVTVIE